MRKFILVSLLSVVAASAQSVSIGVVGGAPFTDVVNGNTVNGLQSIAKSTNFTIGPSLQIGLPLSLRLEIDALYRPASFSLTGRTSTAADYSANQFRFPVLLQYRFSAPLIKPFVEGGFSYDHLSGLSSAFKSLTSGPGQLLNQSNASIVLGAGADVKIPLFRLSGELRYTRQTVSNFANISNLNQAEVLVGIHF
ncbi:MAG: outer membrane beta-barrel protein [Terriglobia bacterium]